MHPNVMTLHWSPMIKHATDHNRHRPVSIISDCGEQLFTQPIRTMWFDDDCMHIITLYKRLTLCNFVTHKHRVFML
jgi:hypothetical protein